MNQTFNLLFFLKKSKIKTDGTAPIYLRITIDGIRKEIASKRYTCPDQWDNKAQKVMGRTPQAKSLNDYLDTFKEEVRNAQHSLMKDKKIVSSSTVKAKVIGTDRKARMLIPIFKEHNKKIEALVPSGEYAQGTVDRYTTSLSHTQNFLKWKFGIDDIDISEIDYAFVCDYDFYLRTEKGCANNTTVKYIKNFQKIIKICLDNEWIEKDPFKKYTVKLKEVLRDILTEEEIQTIYSKRFVTPRLTLVRDIFIFSCYTGLAYIDVKQLKQANIVIGIDGERWIHTQREKTENPSHIPLLPIAEEILRKYANYPKCLNKDVLLPILSNQKMNDYLKPEFD